MNDAQRKFKLYRCGPCGFVYNERAGLPDEFIEPGTSWDEVPEDWSCPDCGSAKSEFHPG